LSILWSNSFISNSNNLFKFLIPMIFFKSIGVALQNCRTLNSQYCYLTKHINGLIQSTKVPNLYLSVYRIANKHYSQLCFSECSDFAEFCNGACFVKITNL
jgi:hypothetical protein